MILFHLQITPSLRLPRKRLQMSLPLAGDSIHLIAAYYRSVDPKGQKAESA